MTDYGSEFWLSSWECDQAIREADQHFRNGDLDKALTKAREVLGIASSMVAVLTVIRAEEKS